ncbi:MAG: hypothetical protein HEQ35_31335 [Gloeotrichia echinulata IR180]
MEIGGLSIPLWVVEVAQEPTWWQVLALVTFPHALYFGFAQYKCPIPYPNKLPIIWLLKLLKNYQSIILYRKV